MPKGKDKNGNGKSKVPRDGGAILRQAEKQGCRVERCPGDHVKVYGPPPNDRSFVVVCDREMGTGLAARIVKDLRRLGVVITALIGVAALLAVLLL